MQAYETKMGKTLNALESELTTIRAGRANPHILDKLTVDYYGAPTPLQQVANISVPEARMIQIQPWESSMIKAIEKSPHIFSVSSKMIQMYHPELIDSAGDLYTLMGWGVCRGTGRPVSNYTKADQIFTACAGAAIYRRSAFSKIGLFDENHFAYLEDIDVGYRAKIYGYKNTYCPTALVYHVGSGTSGSKYNSFKVKLSARNNIYLNYKNMPFLQLVLNFIPLFLGCVVKYLFFMRKGFGEDYACGIKEGLSHAREQKKVAFKLRHLPNYILIEFELILHTLSYARDWFRRKLFKK